MIARALAAETCSVLDSDCSQRPAYFTESRFESESAQATLPARFKLSIESGVVGLTRAAPDLISKLLGSRQLTLIRVSTEKHQAGIPHQLWLLLR